jgi:hypothetical protein
MNDPVLAFLATVVGSFTTLLGVLITLRWSQKDQERSIQIERGRRKDEREYNARRESLVAANEAITRFIQFFLTLPDKSLPSNGEQIDEVRDMGIALNRLHYFFTLETLSKMMDLGKVLNQSFAHAVKAKLPSAFLYHDILAIDTQINNLEQMNAAIHQEIEALLQSSPESQLIIAHRTQLAQNHRRVADLNGEKAELIEKRHFATEECRDVVHAAIPDIFESLRNALIVARKELSFELEETDYNELMSQNLTEMTAFLQELIDDVRNAVRDKMQ